MGKGSRLRALKATKAIVVAKMKEADEKHITQMGQLGMKEFDVRPIDGKSRRQRRIEARWFAKNRNRAVHNTNSTPADVDARRAKVLQKQTGEAASIKKARDIDFRARRATMEVK